ncbi:hypothetical protein BCR44DRAFT_1425430 [Catenaria anguillulae PL171]|uniref:Uncharacterized protein n=1 Tax=Catenaria anguillulae PL171 TaxID=765915 RepID=A0A1Y2HYW7_9FUNG|nr:hypothetical protein BCR44DRAFT_1425430 [Catenaria anguillulae PL171]
MADWSETFSGILAGELVLKLPDVNLVVIMKIMASIALSFWASSSNTTPRVCMSQSLASKNNCITKSRSVTDS